MEGDERVSHNVYWLPAEQDDIDFSTGDWFTTRVRKSADLRGVLALPDVELKIAVSGVPGAQSQILGAEVNLENPGDALAFFLEARLIDKKTGHEVTPVLWADNYVSLVPGDKTALSVRFLHPVPAATELVLVVRGVNVKEQRLPVTLTSAADKKRDALRSSPLAAAVVTALAEGE
jgi:exo-1,4-beta-D-glucosaminidase